MIRSLFTAAALFASAGALAADRSPQADAVRALRDAVLATTTEGEMRVGDLLPREHERFDVRGALLVERLPDRGQRQLSRGSKNQPALQCVLKLLNVAADRICRQPVPAKDLPMYPAYSSTRLAGFAGMKNMHMLLLLV